MAFNGITFRMPPNAIFFDTREVETAADKAERKVLSRFGYYTRKDAKSSMRRRKNPSKPGNPPRVVTGLLKRFIFFGYDKFNSSVVTGPAILHGFEGAGEAPEALEHGTDADIKSRPFMSPAFERQLDDKMPALWKDTIK